MNTRNLGDLLKAHVKVEGYFFRHAAGMALGALPFTLVSIGSVGIAAAASWGVIYLALTLPGWIVFVFAVADVIRVARGRRPTFFARMQSISREDVDKMIDRMPLVGRLWTRLQLDFGFYMHPLTVPTLFLAGYIRDRHTEDGPAPTPAAQDAYAAKVRRRERQIEEIEFVGVA